ncbi:unnamed protein product [Gordionus sp. m RMFG-2023]
MIPWPLLHVMASSKKWQLNYRYGWNFFLAHVSFVLINGFMKSSTLLTCALTWDRYTALTFPHKYKAFSSPPRVIIIIIVCFLTSFIVMIPRTMRFKVFPILNSNNYPRYLNSTRDITISPIINVTKYASKYKHDKYYFTLNEQYKEKQVILVYDWIREILLTVVPLIVIIFLNTQIILRFRKLVMRKRLMKSGFSEPSMQEKLMNNKIKHINPSISVENIEESIPNPIEDDAGLSLNMKDKNGILKKSSKKFLKEKFMMNYSINSNNILNNENNSSPVSGMLIRKSIKQDLEKNNVSAMENSLEIPTDSSFLNANDTIPTMSSELSSDIAGEIKPIRLSFKKSFKYARDMVDKPINSMTSRSSKSNHKPKDDLKAVTRKKAKYERDEKRLTSMLISAGIQYFICCVPQAVAALIDNPHLRQQNYFRLIIIFTNVLEALNYMLNFYVYLIFVKDFAKHAKKILLNICLKQNYTCLPLMNNCKKKDKYSKEKIR